MEIGTPKQETMWSSRMQVTSAAFSEVVGKAFIYSEKVSTRVRRYLCFNWGHMSKVNLPSCPGICPLVLWVGNEGGGLIPPWGGCLSANVALLGGAL